MFPMMVLAADDINTDKSDFCAYKIVVGVGVDW